LDGQKAAEAAAASLQRLEAVKNQQLTPGQTARWIIHFAFALERLIIDGTSYPCSEQDYLAEQSGALLDQIREAVAPVEASGWGRFPPGGLVFVGLLCSHFVSDTRGVSGGGHVGSRGGCLSDPPLARLGGFSVLARSMHLMDGSNVQDA